MSQNCPSHDEFFAIHAQLHRRVLGKHDTRPGNDFQHAWRRWGNVHFRFVTQNMQKGSKNTTWVNDDPDHRKITWVFEEGAYSYKVREYVTGGNKRNRKRFMELYKLHGPGHDELLERREIALDA